MTTGFLTAQLWTESILTVVKPVISLPNSSMGLEFKVSFYSFGRSLNTIRFLKSFNPVSSKLRNVNSSKQSNLD